MCKAVYILASFFISLALVMSIWGAGICVIFIFGCSFAGFFLLCHYLKKMKIQIANIIRTIGQWILKNKKTAVWSILIISLIVLAIMDFTNIVSYIKTSYDKAASVISLTDLQRQMSDDFVEVVTAIAIGTVISVMTIAFPLIFNEMHYITDRYKTNYIIALLYRGKIFIFFTSTLAISVTLSSIWVICYFFKIEALCAITFYLFIFTLLLIISMILLVVELTQYTMPDKLLKIVKKEINKHKAPKYYFDRNVYNPSLYTIDSPQENQRLKKLHAIEEYDSKTTKLYIIVARIYALFIEDNGTSSEILSFFDEKCRKDSYLDGNMKRYTNCYYNFIYGIADWAIGHNNTKLQEEVIRVTNVLLKAHLGKPRRLGERETEEHIKKYALSWETLECLWKVMRKSVASTNEDMFKAYWQVVNNFYSLKYEDIKLTKEQKATFEAERQFYSQVQYLSCAYVLGCKKFNLIDYILNYSQQMPFAWFLIPNTVEELIPIYVAIKQSYSNLTYEMHFSFTEDYNMFSDIIRKNPISQFTNLILFILWRKDVDLSKISIEGNNSITYLNQLYDIAEATNKDTEWIQHLQLEILLDKKDEILSGLKSVIKNHESASAQSGSHFRRNENQSHCANNFGKE